MASGESYEGAGPSTSVSELETLVGASRGLRRCVDEGNEEGIDSVLKDMLRFVNQIKEDPDLLEPEAAADVIVKELTIVTLALVLNNYVKPHASSSSPSSMTNGHPVGTPYNLMRAVRVAQIVAEVAKIEVMREHCVQSGIIPSLVSALEISSKGELIRTHACRAIGNICFDCNLAREAVGEVGGLNKLLDLMNQFQNDENNQLTGDDISKLRRMMTGCLLNLTNTSAPLQEKSLELGAVTLLRNYLTRFGAVDEDLVQTTLLCIGGLAESPKGLALCAQAKVASAVVPILNAVVPIVNAEGGGVGGGGGLSEEEAETAEGILELLAQLAEDDYVKLELASSVDECDCASCLIRLVRETIENPSFDSEGDEERQSVGKLSSDLIVTLVTGDKAMERLYDDGKGIVFEEAHRWLSSSNEQLQTAGALIIGNFARNDENCKRLVHLGVAELLIASLKTAPLEKTEALQHAVLSTLRNLAIPLQNKPVLLDKGILGTVLPLSKSPTFQIQFKLLGLIRMLVDNQPGAALALGKNSVFVQLIVDWCEVKDNPGIRSEAVRLIAWLVKNSRSKEVMEIVVAKGGFPHLANMVQSEHVVMQNEALISITLIFSNLPEDQLVDLTEILVEKLKGALNKPEGGREEGVAEAMAAAASSAGSSPPTELTSSPESLANLFTLLTLCADRKGVKEKIGAEEELLNLAKTHADSAKDKVANGAKSVINKYT